MAAGAGAIRMGETLFGPAALPPPPTRHALFLLVLGLAALVQFGALFEGDLWQMPEGQHAGAAREMWQTHRLFVPTNNGIEPPLSYWLVIVSFKIFGVSAAAARFPAALASVATTAAIFWIGERLANYWRGFNAALIYLSLTGVAVFGHIATAAPISALFIALGIYAALAGYQERRRRHWWFAGAWFATAMAGLSGGLWAIVALAFTLGGLALLHREARLRFRGLLWWPYGLFFAALIFPWLMEWRGRNFVSLPEVRRPAVPPVAILFPWCFAILPALLVRWRQVLRPGSRDFNDDLPWAWAGATLFSVLLFGRQNYFPGIALSGGLALWFAMIWERTSANLRIAGALTVAAVAAISLPLVRLKWRAQLPAETWTGIPTAILITLILGAVTTIWLTRRRLESVASIGLALAMLPISSIIARGLARSAPSFHEAGRFLRSHLGQNGQVLFEGSPALASSLDFYLDRQCALVNQPELGHDIPRDLVVTENTAMDRLAEPRPVFLVIEQNRVGHWREILTQRFHVYHQVAICGRFVVLSNQL